MRTPLGWLIVLAIVFFGVGEFAGGWYLGVAAQTPVLVYKKTITRTVSRTTSTVTSFPFKVSGSLRSGTLTVQGVYERRESIQNPNSRPIAARVLFSQTYEAGSAIRIDQTLRSGDGIYSVYLIFTDATGRLSVDVPNNSEL